jgi:general secretion pathway protein L
MNRTRFVFLSPDSESSATYLSCGDDGAILERGTLARADALAPAHTVLVLPGCDVLTRFLELPDSTPAQMMAAASLALKSEIAAPLEELHVAIGAANSGGLRPVCVIDRAVLASYMDRAAELGIVPDRVVPDHLMLAEPENDSVCAASLGSQVIVRGRNLAFTCEPELARLLVGSRSIHTIEGDIEHIVGASALSGTIDLLPRDFARKRKGAITLGSFKRAAYLAAALLLSPLALWSAEIAAAHFSARALELRADAMARSLPGAGQSGDPAAYARWQLSGMKTHDRYFLATSLLFDAVAQSDGIELESYAYRNDGVIRAVLLHAGAPEIEKLIPILEQAGVSATSEPATDNNGRAATALIVRPLP